MSATPTTPRSCSACGGLLADAANRFCGTCGQQVDPPTASARSTPPHPHAPARIPAGASTVPYRIDATGPSAYIAANRPGSTPPALLAIAGVLLVLLFAGLAAVVILAVTGNDAAGPDVSAAARTTVTVITHGP